MASLDVDSLFANVPLEETINICVNELFKSKSSIHGLNKKQITEMFFLTTKKLIILFDMDFYIQVYSVAIESTLGPSLANALLCHHETKWLNDCPENLNQRFIKGMQMTFLFFSKDLNMLNLSLTI